MVLVRALIFVTLGAAGLVTGAACARAKGEVRPAEPVVTGFPVNEDDCTGETPLLAGAPGSPGNLLPSELHDQGASELAMLMRVMQEDLHRSANALRQEARGGDVEPASHGEEKAGPLHPTHRRIRCAWPTDPAERTPSFDAFAIAYLAQVKSADVANVEAAPLEVRRAAHNRVVDGCRACHETTCSGPLPAIEKLRVTE